MKNLVKYVWLGVWLLSGVMFVGVFGMGKILFVCVVVGEVGVLFILIFVFEFVEFYVGMGAARVCEVFVRVKV